MSYQEDYLSDLKKLISKEVMVVKEIVSIFASSERTSNQEEEKMIDSQINSLKDILKKTNAEISEILEDMSIIKPLPSSGIEISKPIIEHQEHSEIKKVKHIIDDKPKTKKIHTTKHPIVDLEITDLEKKTIKRLKKKKEKIVKKKERKASKYVRTANKIFGDLSHSLSGKQIFITLKRDLIKANLQFIPTSYISVIFLTTILSAVMGVFIFLFFLLFNIGVGMPIVTSVTENLTSRFLKVFWILFAVPIGTFLVMYIYPSVEKSYIENKINQELPFATIHMSAISGSMVEPSKIFSIIISTKEYPFLQKEFTKLINQINVYGYDLITALRNVAFNSPSSKLTELLNGLATTINSGGDLQNFFEKRSQTLLFEYRIEREKYTKTAETFMDIYISVVIAAPMILMLLLIMMRVSGLGISLSTSMITLVIILGVSMVNILFLTFLQLKQPAA